MNTTVTTIPEGLVSHEGNLFEPFEEDLFKGHRPVSIPVQKGQPTVSWKGGRIDAVLWNQIKSFFQEHKAHEVQVRLFYNVDTKKWGAWAMPQTYGTGMTTNEIEDHANRAEGFQRFPAEQGWRAMGTVHHHCEASAFQSGTDTADERNQAGLHITVGHLSKPKFDIDARVCYISLGELDAQGQLVRASTQSFYKASLWEWFEVPSDWVSINAPFALWGAALEAMLTSPVEKDAISYPAEWKANLIEDRRTTSRKWGSYGATIGFGGYDAHLSTTTTTFRDKVFAEVLDKVEEEIARQVRGGRYLGELEEMLNNPKHINYQWVRSLAETHLKKSCYGVGEWVNWARTQLPGGVSGGTLGK